MSRLTSLVICISLTLGLWGCWEDTTVTPDDQMREVCDNGRDDDHDGFADCDDCAPLAYCTTEVCDNGVDDNLDGAVDCDDQHCRFTIGCTGYTCDPVTSEGCEDGYFCEYQENPDRPFFCSPVWDTYQEEGEACLVPYDCLPGLMCVLGNPIGHCRRACHIGALDECLPGESCVTVYFSYGLGVGACE
ncbi:hypothetical protein KKF84_09030 [Myxococcota bacterium]|nr:hypothetical protein [Myxococcota bacterium]MBU1535453.1 hypothetical protein [Myxococcota bacterium]